MSDRFAELLQTITTLRAPGGCPWDQKQTLNDAARYLLDEAGELVDATLAGDLDNVREELGDLLFMNCFCCEILKDEQDVDMYDIAGEGNTKLIRRHPHVFGEAEAKDMGESQERWNAIKAAEKRAKGLDPDNDSALKEMPASTAPLHLAYKYQKNAAAVGFDWPDIGGVWDKLHEELGEVQEAVGADDQDAVEAELGDLLFAVVNLARWLKVQPDIALRRANRRFRDRFHLVEKHFRTAKHDLASADLEEMEAVWQAAKAELAARSTGDS